MRGAGVYIDKRAYRESDVWKMEHVLAIQGYVEKISRELEWNKEHSIWLLSRMETYLSSI
jgi:hypothetical protein